MKLISIFDNPLNLYTVILYFFLTLECLIPNSLSTFNFPDEIRASGKIRTPPPTAIIDAAAGTIRVIKYF